MHWKFYDTVKQAKEWQNIDLLLVTSLADVETGHPEIFYFQVS